MYLFRFLQFYLFFAGFQLAAQSLTPQQTWHLSDPAQSGFFGISLDKAYDFLQSQQLKSKPVVIALIGSGFDLSHEDLNQSVWNNPKEIPGNGIDDDHNGYIDDVHGWNFLGGLDGSNVVEDSYEAARVYHSLKNKWGGRGYVSIGSLSPEEAFEYKMWLRAKAEVKDNVDFSELPAYRTMYATFSSGDLSIRQELKKEEYTCKDIRDHVFKDSKAEKAKDFLIKLCNANVNDGITNLDILEQLKRDIKKMEMGESAPRDFRREIVRDNYDDINDRLFGNNNVFVDKNLAITGTHDFGIIAGSRMNGIGINGIADNVKVMAIRAVPDGDEHDKDIALAIRYAVDQGAKIIGFGFWKNYSPEKKWVDDAVRYAESKNVLLVHGAGNTGQNLDTFFSYPSPVMLDGSRVKNWITVGASGKTQKDGGLTAYFSNHSKKEVDVFAPGSEIYSTVPTGNQYGELTSSSGSASMVMGMAALILGYFPSLSAEQVKMVIERSVKIPVEKVKYPGTDSLVYLSDLCRTGGIVNAYEAVKLAKMVAATNEATLVKNDIKEPQRATEKTDGAKITAAETSIEPGKYYALIIGVSSYTDNRLNLANPLKDAKNLRDILVSRYTFQDSTTFLIQNPTRQEIMNQLYRLRRIAGTRDNVLIFYAGHGYWDEDVQQGYWWPKDATRDNPSVWLSNSDLREQIRGIKCAHTLLISDACFSGGLFRTRNADDLTKAALDIQLLYKMPSRRAMTSGTLTAVPDRSAFLEFLTKRLRENPDKFLSAQQLFQNMRTAIINNSSVVPQEGVIAESGDEGGDFIFILRNK